MESVKLHHNIEVPIVSNGNIQRMLDSINIGAVLHDMGIATDSDRELFDAIASNNVAEMLRITRGHDNTRCAMMAFASFLNEFNNRMSGERLPHRLAIEDTSNKLLIWAEIEDDDEEMERALLLADACASVSMASFNYGTSILVVERSDNLSIPSHYRVAIPFEGAK